MVADASWSQGRLLLLLLLPLLLAGGLSVSVAPSLHPTPPHPIPLN